MVGLHPSVMDHRCYLHFPVWTITMDWWGLGGWWHGQDWTVTEAPLRSLYRPLTNKTMWFLVLPAVWLGSASLQCACVELLPRTVDLHDDHTGPSAKGIHPQPQQRECSVGEQWVWLHPQLFVSQGYPYQRPRPKDDHRHHRNCNATLRPQVWCQDGYLVDLDLVSSGCNVGWIKGIVHPKMKIMSFAHPDVPNLYDLLYSGKHKQCFEKCHTVFCLYCESHCCLIVWMLKHSYNYLLSILLSKESHSFWYEGE